jgi:hypothetical protein
VIRQNKKSKLRQAPSPEGLSSVYLDYSWTAEDILENKNRLDRSKSFLITTLNPKDNMKNSHGWLYQLCPNEILGEKLIPLNRQQLLFQSLHQKNYEIYAGREAATRRCIPLLECYWNEA